MSARASEFVANIGGIREVEDTIRASGQYTESMGTMWRDHPVQGKEFGSLVLHKDYHVYPGTFLDWDMPINSALKWLWDTRVTSIDVTFYYDYRRNRAKLVAHGGAEDIKILAAKITGFSDALSRATVGSGGQIAETAKAGMGAADRVGGSPVPDPQSVVNPANHQQ